MQSPLAYPSSNNQRHVSGTADGGRRLSSARSSDSFGLGYDSHGMHQRSEHSLLPRSGANSFTPSPQSPYPIQGYMESSSFSPSNTHTQQLLNNDWHSPRPLTAMSPRSPSGDVTYLGASSTSRGNTHVRNGHYHPQSGFTAYDNTLAPLSPLYHTPSPSDNYGGPYVGAPAPSFPEGSSYTGSHPASFAYAMQPVRHARPQEATPRCEWVNCRMLIDDSSPAGIARHLKQHHDVQVVDNRSRHPCKWGTQPCGKDMYPSSLGKHIAECHLRNMVKQCPHCGADFARADTLSRHIKAFCPNFSG